jgi:hypothetical protein
VNHKKNPILVSNRKCALNDFYFGFLHPVARALSRLSGKNRPSQQLFKAFIPQPLHVSAFTGHHQAHYIYYILTN